MSKAVISNRIYMDLPDNKDEIFKALTYKIETRGASPKYSNVEFIRNYKMVTPKIISIPQGRTDLIPSNYQIIDKRVLEFADIPDPKLDLFKEQQEIYDQVEGSAFINALVGWGKTFTALHIAHKLGQKTLVVTHTTQLRDQWVKEVETLYGFIPGVIGSGKCNLTTPIVIGNIQSLYPISDQINKSFGTIILDEAHHVPANTFTKLINDSHAMYRIALSGTMQRKDGRHVLFRDFFGSKVFTPKQSNTVNPTIQLINSGVMLPPGKTWADRVSNLLADTGYRDLIKILALKMATLGHKVLVIADRVEFLESLSSQLYPRAVCVVGSTIDRDVELQKIKDGTADILFGSRQIFSEGISVNELSCVILAVPIANRPTLEQIIGRVMRLHPDKLDPVVIDIQFKGAASVRQSNERLGLYLEKGWDIKAL